MLEIIRRVGKDEGIDVRGAEEMKVRPLADDYGEVVVAVSFTCRIDQFVNFMTDLANRPGADGHQRHPRSSASNPKEKTVLVRLGLSGVVPRKLVPREERTGLAVKRKLLLANLVLLALSVGWRACICAASGWKRARANRPCCSSASQPVPPPPLLALARRRTGEGGRLQRHRAEDAVLQGPQSRGGGGTAARAEANSDAGLCRCSTAWWIWATVRWPS